tara:strand:+ start:352 stop:909 length:558 start_codon:yes stop_codon:yes gene_type:complete
MLKKIGIGLVALIILAVLFGEDDGGSGSSSSTSGSSSSASGKISYMNQWVESDYFKVGVTGVSETTRSLNEYMCEPAPNGSKYVLIALAIENTDTESRTLMEEGELHIDYDGKTLEYDQTESCTMGQDGYINFMDSIGPMVRLEGSVAFVVPQRFDISDMVYQVPRGYEKIVLQAAPVEAAGSEE